MQQRHAALQSRLAERVRELEEALGRVRQLQGLLPICCYCKKIRDDQNYWQQVETYISAHSDTRFSQEETLRWPPEDVAPMAEAEGAVATPNVAAPAGAVVLSPSPS